jgi:hypothetical protein
MARPQDGHNPSGPDRKTWEKLPSNGAKNDGFPRKAASPPRESQGIHGKAAVLPQKEQSKRGKTAC